MQMAMNTMKVQKNCDTCSRIIIKDNYLECSMCSKNYHIKSHCLGIDKNNLKNYKAGKILFALRAFEKFLLIT